jgi:hypothetical protein
MKIIATALFALLAPTLAQAQEAPACAVQVTLPSATNADGLDKVMLTPGRMTAVALHPTNDVAYPVQPEKPGGSAAHGGIVAIALPQAGTWQVGLGAGAWIDVLQNGVTVVSTAHGHGTGCLRKMVDFPLTAGRVTIQISGNADPSLMIMVAPKP